jgi:hypothetical protein
MSAEPHTPAEQFWQAFRYASDEMTAAEREAFEHVLAADQSAREAVARVVELEGLVRTAESAPVEIGGRPLSVLPIERNYWLQPLGWVALGAAACLAVVMAFQAWWPVAGAVAPDAPQVAVGSGSILNGGDVSGSHATGSELALAWARAQAELPAPNDSSSRGSETVIREAAIDEAAIEETGEYDLVSVGDDQVAAAPAWLLAAVADAEAAHDEN